MKGKLILEDGSVFTGQLLNDSRATGEVVFNTSMTGYQESLTDPSYCRQILTLTYPMVGNYGIADIFMQSRKAFVGGFVIGELCELGSNWHYEESLAEFLTRQNIPCLYDVDTRAVTRKIRNAGTMKGIIVPADAEQAEIDKLMAVPIKKEVVMEVTTKEAYTMEAENEDAPLVVAMDFGVKQNILTSLHNIGCMSAKGMAPQQSAISSREQFEHTFCLVHSQCFAVSSPKRLTALVGNASSFN